MSDWTQRLQRLQADLPQPEISSIEHLTLENLKIEKVKFGKAHLMKTYQEVWETSPDWVKWFLGHYQQNQNLEHRKMIKFIQMKIEEGETQNPGTSQAPIMPKPKPAPKSFTAIPKSRPSPSSGYEVENQMPGSTENPWVEQDPNTGRMMNQLQDRMSNLELALHQILNHLAPAPANGTMTAAMEEELPVLPLVSEWEDPWSN